MLKKMFSIVLALSFFIVSIGSIGNGVEAASDAPFNDIDSHWAKENIIKAKNSGLIDGFPDGSFRPDAIVTADQFVSMMLRVFSDGNGKLDQEWINELMYIQPSAIGRFNTAMKKTGFNFTNAKTGYWAKPYIDMLYEVGLLLSFDEVFPQKPEIYKKQITREKASYLLGVWVRKYEKEYENLYSEFVIANSGLKDFNSFTNTTVKNFRGVVLMAGLMNGYPDKNFYPHRYVTRAEALTMIQRLRDKEIRIPFKPNLAGKYYTELDGRITLYSDKTKFDYYNSIVKLAEQDIKTGYFSKSSGSINVWDSKDTFEKNDFLTRMGDYDSVPPYEFSAGVVGDNTRQIGIAYPIKKSTNHSLAFQTSVFELLAGTGKGKELKNLLSTYEKAGKPASFKFNGKSFDFFGEGKYYVLKMNY
ncbi:S-layer homology domain-containing protein [Paenibacillus sp. 2TAB26]|uniref:S-layer homology domain-containing protein n=1 Tax=Paenibacillus sp. 2TAB26 TaxID=3233005 RepID=UPI003F9BF8A5